MEGPAPEAVSKRIIFIMLAARSEPRPPDCSTKAFLLEGDPVTTLSRGTGLTRGAPTEPILIGRLLAFETASLAGLSNKERFASLQPHGSGALQKPVKSLEPFPVGPESKRHFILMASTLLRCEPSLETLFDSRTYLHLDRIERVQE